MLDTSASLLPVVGQSRKPVRVLIMGTEPASMDEMERLLTTLGVISVGRISFSEKKLHPATYVGMGKIEEAKAQIVDLSVDALIFDLELSPNQLRNIEKIVEKPVLDRPGVIIEIFSQHARSKEAKTQVELAKLQYLLPRLRNFWTHFERQRGGIGQKGMGEKQIEVDRRLVKKRMSVLQGRLKEIESERKLRRLGRSLVYKVALVGYTNAGKSTLLNALTQSKVLAEDKLFATLDPSIRTLDPHSHPPVVAIDTVGFIKKLPTSLVASFRSTLEEIQDADLILHIVDGSSAYAKEEYVTTREVLDDLGLKDRPVLVAVNKCDLLKSPAQRNQARIIAPGAIAVSALEEDEVKKLRDQILNFFSSQMELLEVVIPYSESKLEAQMHAHGTIETKRHLEKGTFYRIRMGDGWAKKLDLARFKT